MDHLVLPATEEHFEGWHAALDSVARERIYLAFLEAPPLAEFRKFVLGNLRAGRPQFVAMVGGRGVGWCDSTSLNRPAFAHSGVLGMGVIDGYRRRGVGHALIQAALNRPHEIRFTRVELTVREDNRRAMSLYGKTGFVMEGVKRRGVRVDGKYEDLYCMGLLLE